MIENTHIDLIRLGIFLAYGACVAVVFLHASFTDRNVLLWTLLALIPIFGIIIYFMVGYSEKVGDAARRAHKHKERQWEFVLTDKGKKSDPNAPPPEEKIPQKPSHPGHRPEVIDESPPSRE